MNCIEFGTVHYKLFQNQNNKIKQGNIKEPNRAIQMSRLAWQYTGSSDK
jgi:hypothetical protein